jgi:hypothetical protein
VKDHAKGFNRATFADIRSDYLYHNDCGGKLDEAEHHHEWFRRCKGCKCWWTYSRIARLSPAEIADRWHLRPPVGSGVLVWDEAGRERFSTVVPVANGRPKVKL